MQFAVFFSLTASYLCVVRGTTSPTLTKKVDDQHKIIFNMYLEKQWNILQTMMAKKKNQFLKSKI